MNQSDDGEAESYLFDSHNDDFSGLSETEKRQCMFVITFC